MLIILATVSINAVLGENGIIAKAQRAGELYQNSSIAEEEAMNELLGQYGNIMNSDTIGGGETTGTNTTTETPVEPTPTGPAVTIGGSTVTLTQNNVYRYLGKVVENYTGQTSVTINGTSYTVSPTYRLYYVDFDNKYGYGAGTIYLKAECTSNKYSLPATDTTSDTATNIKIKSLNPSLYATGVTSPTSTNGNMKAVTFLTNTTNWANLADTTHTELSGKINYIVGSPSLEMMMDSYNTHYQLTGTTPDYSAITAGTRRKLFYKYTSSATGYQVGPCFRKSAEYERYTSDNSVYTDSEIDTMYYPGSSQYYWLASPSAGSSNGVVVVYYYFGGYVNYDSYSSSYAFCPVVSLKSDVQLQLQ